MAKRSSDRSMITRLVRVLKPWAGAVALLLLLRYTGLLAGISSAAHMALMKTGILDASPVATAEQPFDYNFQIRQLDGKVVPFSTFKGKKIFINLWATWCGPCRYEMPSIQKLYQKVDPTKVAFVMISVDKTGQLEKVKKYLQENNFTFPVYQFEGDWPELLRVQSIPATFIVNAQGKVIAEEVGAANYDTPRYKKFLEEGK